MYREHRVRTGWIRYRASKHGHYEVWIEWPAFAPQQGVVGNVRWFWVTGYTLTGIVAGGGHRGGPGDIANGDPGLWGRRICVPSVGYCGVVDDHGVGPGALDLWTLNPYAVTGYREAIIY